jgi:hypothetical protein
VLLPGVRGVRDKLVALSAQSRAQRYRSNSETISLLPALWLETLPAPPAKVKHQGGTVGAIITIHRLLYTLAGFFKKLSAFLLTSRKLHNARFARIDELTSLSSPLKDVDTSLLLGVTQFNHVLSVRPTKTRSELGNLLIVAPTRGGKGLLAISKLLSWKHSVSTFCNGELVELFRGRLSPQSGNKPAGKYRPHGRGRKCVPLMLLDESVHLPVRAFAC